MSLFRGHYAQLIKWKTRYLLETRGTLSQIVVKAIEDRKKNKELLSSCYKYDIAVDPKHSNFIATSKSCNCVLCEITREYVAKKMQLSRFEKSFFREEDESFYYGYLKSKAVNGETYTEQRYFEDIRSNLKHQINELKQQRRAVKSTIEVHRIL